MKKVQEMVMEGSMKMASGCVKHISELQGKGALEKEKIEVMATMARESARVFYETLKVEKVVMLTQQTGSQQVVQTVVDMSKWLGSLVSVGLGVFVSRMMSSIHYSKEPLHPFELIALTRFHFRFFAHLLNNERDEAEKAFTEYETFVRSIMDTEAFKKIFKEYIEASKTVPEWHKERAKIILHFLNDKNLFLDLQL